MEQFVLSAEPRTQFGSRAVSLLRKKGKIPGNIYGHAEANLHVSLDTREFSKFLEAGHRIVTIRLGEKDEHSLVKEVQYDALGTSLIHVDFTRIRRDEKIQVAVPVETVGMPKGLTGGGVLAFTHKEVLVSGFPQDIPEHYILNIEALELGQIIRVKDLTPPPNCVFVEDPEIVVVSVVHQRVEAAPVPVETAAAQPEVIGKKKDEPVEGEEPEGKKKDKEKEK